MLKRGPIPKNAFTQLAFLINDSPSFSTGSLKNKSLQEPVRCTNIALGQDVSRILRERFQHHSEELLKTLDGTVESEWRNEYIKKVANEMAGIVNGGKDGLGEGKRKALNAHSGDLVGKCTSAHNISKIRTQTSILTRLDYMLELAEAGEAQKLKKYFLELVKKSGKMASARDLLHDDGVFSVMKIVQDF